MDKDRAVPENQVPLIARVLFRLRVVDDCTAKTDITERAKEMMLRRIYGQSVRQIADSFAVGKSSAYEHVKHHIDALKFNQSLEDSLYEEGWHFWNAKSVRSILRSACSPSSRPTSTRLAFCDCRPFPLQSSRFTARVRNVDGLKHRNLKHFTCAVCRKKHSAPEYRKLFRPVTAIEAVIGLAADPNSLDVGMLHDATDCLYQRLMNDASPSFHCINAERLRTLGEPLPFDL